MSKFFKYPLNYHNGRSPTNVSDNRYDTYIEITSGITLQPHLTCNVGTSPSGSTQPREITHIFIKGSNIDQISAHAAIDGYPEDITVPIWATTGSQHAVTNDSGETTDINRNGYQNIFLDIRDTQVIDGKEVKVKRSASIVTLNFVAITSTDPILIYQALVLDQMLAIEGDNVYSKIDIDEVDLSVIHTTASGRMVSVPPINNERDRWQVAFTASGRNIPGNDLRENIDELRKFMSNHKNFTFAPEIARYPDMIAPAIFPNRERQMRFLTRSKKTGLSLEFSVREA